MATISFGGLGNGVDFGQVVDQLVKVQQLPIDALQSKKSNLQTKLTDYGTLGGKLVALQSATDALRLPSFFDRTAATVSDESVLGVSASSTATPGTYLVQVTRLATAHQIASKATKTVTATTSDIVSGAGATFSFRVGTSAIQTVTLSDTATLEDLRDQINDLGSGATASIVNTGTSATPAYRLLLTASSTGADRTITITADSTDLDFLNGSGAGGFDTLQLAQDATVVLGDPAQTQLTIQRDSNTITDAIPGVVLNLKQTTAVGQFATVTVSLDTAQVKDNIKKLVTAYNEVVNFITSHNTYDTATKQGGTFLLNLPFGLSCPACAGHCPISWQAPPYTARWEKLDSRPSVMGLSRWRMQNWIRLYPRTIARSGRFWPTKALQAEWRSVFCRQLISLTILRAEP